LVILQAKEFICMHVEYLNKKNLFVYLFILHCRFAQDFALFSFFTGGLSWKKCNEFSTILSSL